MTTQTAPQTEAKIYQMLIEGQWVPAKSGETFERLNPANGTLVGTYPLADIADVDLAVDAARRAFDGGAWSNAPAKQRHDVLRKIADGLRGSIGPMATLLAQEVGKPLNMAMGEVAMSADVYDYFAGISLDMHGEAITQFAPDAIGLTVQEPVGVVGVITPWNFPLLLVSWKLAPALAAGCTVVAKPAQLTPGTTLELGRIIQEAGAPDGVVNVITGPGSKIGQHMAEHPKVDKIAFTGSTEVGRSVMRAAASNIKKLSLELGGKSPNVVFADANIETAVAGAFFAIYLNTGQVCQAGSRLLLQESIKDQFLEKLIAFTKTVKLGDPLDPDTTMGPVVDQKQLSTVEHYVEEGQREGAKMLIGGSRPKGNGLDNGFFFEPTIFDSVGSDMAIAQEEIFGPVLSVLTFKDADEALRIANDTLFGLASAVWTNDLNTAFKMAKGIQAGTVWVNTFHQAGLPNMPYGGYKQSGIGRELGRHGLEEYLETKAIQIKLG
ncbi:MAG: aldehyde dehydrogenase family protein [Chloroflexi bacterium]|nr:aldehyde dehydrogenase family protein [Chloroflexota bacterium]